ncbi:MAG: polysaccharide deacetylase family protein [Eubacteriales bacterium]
MGFPVALLCIAALSVAVYTIIPDLLLHRLGIGSWKRQYSPGVAITFDDGPDPGFTPRILDILSKHRVSATFFVVGEKALKYPDLIKQIRASGHSIGAHSQHHRYAWFMSPMETWKEWKECVTVLENLTGETIHWVRPPWGTFNLVTWLWLRTNNKRAVLWNVDGHDWQARSDEEEIISRVISKTKEGSIVVLHDAGGETGAPENTIKALDEICQRIVREQKLPLVQLSFPEWPVRRRIAFTLWEKWEHIFARLYSVERIDSTNMLRLSKTRYKGPDIYAPNGQLLAQKGDWVGEIHFDNIRFVNNETDVQKIALQALRQAKESLTVFARYIEGNPKYQGIRVFLGLSLMHRGVKRLGFEVQEVPIVGLSRWIVILQKVIARVYHPTSMVKGSKHFDDKLKLVWISRQQLFERWLCSDEYRAKASVK